MTDFIARRKAAIKAERELRAEWEAEEEFRKNINALHYEFEDRVEHERVLRQKYEAAMAEKRPYPTMRER